MFEPLLMSKAIFDGLTPVQQQAIEQVGTSLEAYGLAQAQADDEAFSAIFSKAGVKVQDFTTPALEQWRAIAEKAAWTDFAARNAACAALLKLAESVKA